MTSICFYFQVHQPYRLRKYRIFDIGHELEYFEEKENLNINNKQIIKKVAEKCYLPTNKIILKLLKKYPKFKVCYSFSGILIEQLEKYSPNTLLSFKKIINTGNAEVLSETYYHSLSFLYSMDEFESQIELHREKIKKIFKYNPKVFRNTELIYNNFLSQYIEKLGYKGMLAEGADHILQGRSPNYLYKAKGTKNLKLLLKNYRLSDDIAFRFSSKEWSEYPLTANKFADWVNKVNGNGEVVNLFMDYETFGEHQWEDTGIFDFLEALPEAILKNKDNDFVTPSTAIARFNAREILDVPEYTSWADIERDLSAWFSNDIQKDAMDKLYGMRERVIKSQDKNLIESWKRLTTSDHFYYMCTKWFSDGDVHKYFNPYESPYDAFIYFMRVVTDLELRLEKGGVYAKS